MRQWSVLFYAVCEFLEQTDGYDKKENTDSAPPLCVKIKVKTKWEQLEKIGAALLEPDIIYYTLKYKIKGYY